MDIHSLRRLRLLFEDFPKNHNLVLVAQPSLLHKLSLTVNDDIRSRVTYSVLVSKLAPDSSSPSSTAPRSPTASSRPKRGLIVRSTEGVLRHARTLCIATLLEAVRDRTKTVDLKQVNRVLLQPHWRREPIF